MKTTRNLIAALTTAALLAIPAGAVADEQAPLDHCSNLAGVQPAIPEGLVGLAGYPTVRVLSNTDADLVIQDSTTTLGDGTVLTYPGADVDCAVPFPGYIAPSTEAPPAGTRPVTWLNSRPVYKDTEGNGSAASIALMSFGLASLAGANESTGIAYGGAFRSYGALNYLKVAGGTSVSGTQQADYLMSWAGSDQFGGRNTVGVSLAGLGGRDNLSGSDTASDKLDGGAGDDLVRSAATAYSYASHRDRDRLLGGAGNDLLIATDGEGDDTVNCGIGKHDVAFIDKGDRTTGCEKIVVEKAGRGGRFDKASAAAYAFEGRS